METLEKYFEHFRNNVVNVNDKGDSMEIVESWFHL